MKKNVHQILCTDIEFPNQLKNVKPRVKTLYACGDIGLFNKRLFAIVGSRNNSEYGKNITEKITKMLVYNNLVIVSGMAVGIDSIAHKTCIENGGKTIAVLGSGINNVYPKENLKLFYQIIESGGLVVSEFQIDTPVQKKNFPRRNRIISGLSEGVLVVEGAYRSGTSITAKNAIIQGKKVFYVPNCIGNKNSYGPIKLAKEGALMATCGEDILSELDIDFCIEQDNSNKAEIERFDNVVNKMDKNTKKIFMCLRELGCLDCERISLETNINVVEVNQLLSYMELDDLIVATEINKYKVCDKFCE